MSSPNMDLVRSINVAHERGDFSSIDWADPGIVYVIADGPSPGRWTGAEAMAAGFRENLIGWKNFRTEADEYRELDDERVLVLTRSTAQGKAAGMVVGQMRTKGAAVYHLSAGKVTRLVYYWERERALADVGLRLDEAC